MEYIETNEDFSYNLKVARIERGLSQKQIANKMYIDRSTYTYYETGKTLPSIFQLISLSKILNVNIMYFFIKQKLEFYF